MQSSVECPVCMSTYVPRTQPPKVLTCGHGVCVICVQTLLSKVNGSTITCPKCRASCKVPDGKPGNLPTNFQILELVDTLCGECCDNKHSERCGVCPTNVCVACREQHQQRHSSNMIEGLKELKSLTSEMNDLLSDDDEIKETHDRFDRIKGAMSKHLDDRIQVLKDEYEKKIVLLERDRARQVDSLLEWRGKSRQLSIECAEFLDKVRYTRQHSSQPSSIRINEGAKQQMKEKIAALNHMMSRKPKSTEVPFSLNYGTEGVQMKRFRSEYTQTNNDSSPTVYSLVPDYLAAVPGSFYDKNMKWPWGVCSDPVTDTIIATDYDRHEVIVLNAGLQLLQSFGSKGQKKYRYKSVCGVASSGDNWYICDSSNHCLHVLDGQGNEVCTTGTEGSGEDNYQRPSGLAMDNSGNIFVCDLRNNRIKVIDTQGAFIREFGQKELDDFPWFIAVSSDGRIAVSTMSGAKIFLFRSSGEFIKAIAVKVSPHNIDATGLAFDGYGHILVADKAGGRIAVMAESGEVVGYFGAAGQLKNPRDITVTKGGNVVVCDSGNKKIQLFFIPKKIRHM